MRRRTLAIGVVLAAISLSGAASADPPAATPASTAPAASLPQLPSPKASPSGLAVIALPAAADAAWPLAQSVYASATLRPIGIDDAHARVLCGERAPDGAPQELRDLADTVAAVHGDDAPSIALLRDVARRLSVRGLIVVRVDAGRAGARVFLADTGAFDAAAYAPDEAPTVAWSAATRSLVRAFGSSEGAPTPTARSTAPSLATREGPELENAPPRKPQFYESGWFWGALGAAAFAAGAVFLATRDNGPTTIHLQMQVPH